RSLQRRYSEATLASDYSRTMDHVLKKNFVEWLLARRERKSDDIAEFKREAESQKSAANGENVEPGAQKSQNFLEWIWKKMENQSFPALEGSEDLREFLDREFVAWLMSGELCRAT
ncbi:GIP protein, partial [Malurus elegans]|nr:GIP protein [Malurus elegans]